MKIDKSNPLHWLYLAAFAIQSILGLLLRPFSVKSVITLYGHKLNGNLLPLYEGHGNTVYLSLDRAYCHHLQSKGIRAQWACGIGAAVLLARSKFIVTDHGLHSLELLLPVYQKIGLKCIDVWHGIPFKGFDADDFRLQHMYNEIWVASPPHKKLYVERYGFPAEKVVVTGYARTDVLVRPKLCTRELRNQLELPSEGPIILFAPTWSQDAQGRSLYPFGHDEAEFLEALSRFAVKHHATIILRTHLNSNGAVAKRYPSIVRMPSSEWTNTESILQVSDVLICDWSSIAFDYLLLNRPTLFLDVPAPFAKGFSLGPEYRFGPVVGNLDDLINELDCAIRRPEEYWHLHVEAHQSVRSEVYEGWDDGQATQRCLERLADAAVGL